MDDFNTGGFLLNSLHGSGWTILIPGDSFLILYMVLGGRF